MENKTNIQNTTKPRHCRVFDVGNSAFLDDKLHYYTLTNLPTEPKEVQELVNDLYAICQQQYISKIDPKNLPTRKEMKAHFDRAFNSWNAFIVKLKKNEYLIPLAELLEKHSFKSSLLKDPVMKDFYDACF